MRKESTCKKVAKKMLERCLDKGWNLNTWIAPGLTKEQKIEIYREVIRERQAVEIQPCLFNSK